MDYGEATRKLREMRQGLRAAENNIRENTGYIGQIARLAFESAHGDGAAMATHSEGVIVRNLVEALSALETAQKRISLANRELNAARSAADEANRKRAENARRLGIN